MQFSVFLQSWFCACIQVKIYVGGKNAIYER